MKHATLRSIAHNLADSLADGLGLPIGVFQTDIFGEVGRSGEGFITVDFLNGTTKGASAKLAKAVSLYQDALPAFCEKQGASVSAFRELTARYSIDPLGRRVLVTVEDSNGRRSTDEYVGLPLKRIKTVDDRGRVRAKRH